MKLELNVNVVFSQEQLDWLVAVIQRMPEYPPEGCPVGRDSEEENETEWGEWMDGEVILLGLCFMAAYFAGVVAGIVVF